MDSRNSKQTPLEPVDSAPQDETELHTTRMPAAGQTKPGKRKKTPKRGAQHPRSIFKPRTKNPNFLLSVLVSTVRLSTLLVLCAGLALFGALVGIAKAYVETAPTLDLAALSAQDNVLYARLMLTPEDTLKPDTLVGALAARSGAVDYEGSICRTALLTRREGGEIVDLMEL